MSMVARVASKILATDDGACHQEGSVYTGKFAFPETLTVPFIDEVKHPAVLVRHSQQEAKGGARPSGGFISV